MRILILGGDGMLGHQLLLSWRERHDVRVTLRQDISHYAAYGLFDAANSYCGINARRFEGIERVVGEFEPEAVVNAVGIVKQRQESHDAIISIEINALLPHRLAALCRRDIRLIHLSTDCVFSGQKGMYREDDLPDATDIYGRSKLLGEVTEPPAVTLRTSIIGLELARRRSLIEWFLAQRGRIRGFRRAIYSGFTTLEISRTIEKLLIDHPEISGLWHVASSPISKYDLLRMLAKRLGRTDITIEADDGFICDRSLDGSRFSLETGYTPPAWEAMLDELAERIEERDR